MFHVGEELLEELLAGAAWFVYKLTVTVKAATPCVGEAALVVPVIFFR